MKLDVKRNELMIEWKEITWWTMKQVNSIHSISLFRKQINVWVLIGDNKNNIFYSVYLISNGHIILSL